MFWTQKGRFNRYQVEKTRIFAKSNPYVLFGKIELSFSPNIACSGSFWLQVLTWETPGFPFQRTAQGKTQKKPWECSLFSQLYKTEPVKKNLQSTNTSMANVINPEIDQMTGSYWSTALCFNSQASRGSATNVKQKRYSSDVGGLGGFLNTHSLKIQTKCLSGGGGRSWRSIHSSSGAGVNPSWHWAGDWTGRQVTKPKLSLIYIRSLQCSNQLLFLSAGFEITSSFRNYGCPKKTKPFLQTG